MEKNNFLKIVPLVELTATADGLLPVPLSRFSGIILNLTSNALECVQRLARREMQKKSPSAILMEEYYLLHHYLAFIKRLCLEMMD